MMLREGGLGAYAALGLGGLGLLLGSVAVIALLARSPSAFSLGVVTLVTGAAAAGAGIGGTLFGRRQVQEALAMVGRVDGERILMAGFGEAANAALIGFGAALLPLLLGAVTALAGSRLPRAQTRVQGYAEAQPSADESTAGTMLAAGFIAVGVLATAGAWVVSHQPIPQGRYGFAMDDHDAWDLAGALDEVTVDTARGCDRLHEALQPFWGSNDPREWPRRMRREVPASLSAWRPSADRCAAKVLDGLGNQPEGAAWSLDGLLDSPLLQDDALHARALAWVSKTSDAPPPSTVLLDDGLRERPLARVPKTLDAPTPSTLQGAIPKELVAATLRTALPAIRNCYEKSLTTQPTLAGKVMTSFRIGADGRVDEATEAPGEGPPFPDPKVTECILKQIRALRFPKPNGGGVVKVKYPFVFAPAR
ncbi:MAG: AgmX/PglI C-terminal domain-containing protein [Myxococcales bacterium]|nr:AgmX/PglI C-terminal domain-containing protein [Myxococcales bacterium]